MNTFVFFSHLDLKYWIKFLSLKLDIVTHQ